MCKSIYRIEGIGGLMPGIEEKLKNIEYRKMFLNLIERIELDENIEDVFLGSRGWFGEIWTIFKIWGLVTLKKKKGLLKHVTIAPKNPEDFVSKIKEKMQQRLNIA